MLYRKTGGGGKRRGRLSVRLANPVHPHPVAALPGGAEIEPGRVGVAHALRLTGEDTGQRPRRARAAAAPNANSTVFRVVQYAPGVAPREHRTQTIDYAVVISGEIDMELDHGEVRLRQGDVLVQRGTIHNWVNRGTEPCVIAFILIAAESVEAGGMTLRATG